MSNGTSSSSPPYLISEELWEIRDKRLDDWAMMSSPWPSVALSSAYVLAVTVIGPRFMRDRKPYDIKAVMQVYNVIQVILSAYIVYEASIAGWLTHYSWGE